MTKTKKKDVKKELYLNLIKTALKDKNFIENVDIFDDLMAKSAIDINQNLKSDKNPTFLSYALNDSEKFKYLVEKHGANYHTNTTTDKFMEVNPISIELLEKVIFNTKNIKEEIKILNYLKKDKKVWLNKKITQFNTDKDAHEETFFELYFSHNENRQDELEKILQINYDTTEEKNRFNQAKEDLVIQLCLLAVAENNRYKGHRVKNPLASFKNYLPILAKNNVINIDNNKFDSILSYMNNDSQNLGVARANNIKILQTMLEYNFLTTEKLNKDNFGKKFINQVINKLDNEIKSNKEHNEHLSHYDRSDYARILTEHTPIEFELLIENINKLNEMGIDAYIDKEQKEKILNIINIMQEASSTKKKKSENDEYNKYEILKELIVLSSDKKDSNTAKKIKL